MAEKVQRKTQGLVGRTEDREAHLVKASKEQLDAKVRPPLDVERKTESAGVCGGAPARRCVRSFALRRGKRVGRPVVVLEATDRETQSTSGHTQDTSENVGDDYEQNTSNLHRTDRGEGKMRDNAR